MKGEVNPEMESVRKLVSGRLQTPSAGPHPAADLLSAFAENALPGAERRDVLAHLADCGLCREVVFLSLPQPADGQKVLISPPVRWHSVLRWGSAVASILILAGVFAGRRELFRSSVRLAKSAHALPAPTKNKVAEEKIPADLESMREAGSENQAAKAPSIPVPERPRPDLKHMTAKMQRTLTFGQSDEVQVSPAGSPNVTVDTRAIRDLPVEGRDVRERKGTIAGQPAAAPKALTANAAEGNVKSEFALVPNNYDTALVSAGSRAVAKPATLKPHLAGTVLDASGAVVPNARVATVGPVGTEIVTSDAQGRFAFDLLAPGLYSVKADASGFRPLELKQVVIAANQSPSLKLTLVPGATTENVEVSTQAAVLHSPAAFHGDASVNGKALKQAEMTPASAQAVQPVGNMAGIEPVLQWTLSPAGAVQMSNDDGKSWQMVAVAANPGFRALSAVGPSVWVGGSGGVLYHSVDAGRNWTPVAPAIWGQKLNTDIARIEFLDSRDGSLSTSNGEIWITHDGGNSWERN